MMPVTSKPKSLVWALFQVATTGLCIITLVGFLARWWWPLELVCQFRVQTCGALFIAALLAAVAKGYKQSLVVAAFALVNLCLIAPLYFSAPGFPAPVNQEHQPQLRAAALNVLTSNRRYDKVVQFIHRAEPDFIVLLEVDAGWVDAMRTIEKTYPYSFQLPQSNNFGIAFYSRYKIIDTEVVMLGEPSVPALQVQLDIAGKPMTIIAAHVMPPGNQARAIARNRQLSELGRLAGMQRGAVMLLGDLNITSWSPFFSDLLRDSNLRDSQRGFGVQPTWPARLPLLRIAIDHCLVSDQIAIHRRSVGGNVGSDHFPIIIDFSLIAVP